MNQNFLSLFFSLYLSLCLSFSLSLSLSLYLSHCRSHSNSLSFSLSLSLSLSISLSHALSLPSHSLSLSIILSLCLSFSLSLPCSLILSLLVQIICKMLPWVSEDRGDRVQSRVTNDIWTNVYSSSLVSMSKLSKVLGGGQENKFKHFKVIIFEFLLEFFYKTSIKFLISFSNTPHYILCPPTLRLRWLVCL